MTDAMKAENVKSIRCEEAENPRPHQHDVTAITVI